MKWEYKVISLRAIEELGDFLTIPHRTSDGFRKLGLDGWELVSVDNGIAYFKRLIPIELELVEQTSKAFSNRK